MVLLREANSVWYLFQILHALGLLHEHQRPDRDQYIDVDMVALAKTGAFLKEFQKASFLRIIDRNLNRSQKFTYRPYYMAHIQQTSNDSDAYKDSLSILLDLKH